MSCRARARERSSVLPPNPPLRYSSSSSHSPWSPLARGLTLRLSLSLFPLRGNFPPFHPHSPPLPSSRLLPAHPDPLSTIHPFASSMPHAFFSPFSLPQSTHHRIHLPLLPLASSSSSVISPMSTSPRSTISSPCSHRRLARSILPLLRLPLRRPLLLLHLPALLRTTVTMLRRDRTRAHEIFLPFSLPNRTSSTIHL